jgi:hypothetical protein
LRPAVSERKDHPIKELLTFFDELYTDRVGARYPFNGGKDAKIVQLLREVYSDEDIRTYMTAFFEIQDEFIQQSGYGLGVFRGCLPKVITFAKGLQPRKSAMSEAAATVFRVIGSKAS